MNKKREKGFTLVELIVVIAIVAILASVAIVGYTQFIKNARNTKAQSELDQMYNVLYSDVVAIPYENTKTYKVGDNDVEYVALTVNSKSGMLNFVFDIKDTGDDAPTIGSLLVEWLNHYKGEEESSGLLSGTLTFEGAEIKIDVDGGAGERDIAHTFNEKITIKIDDNGKAELVVPQP